MADGLGGAGGTPGFPGTIGFPAATGGFGAPPKPGLGASAGALGFGASGGALPTPAGDWRPEIGSEVDRETAGFFHGVTEPLLGAIPGNTETGFALASAVSDDGTMGF